jgi:hypothetical protein
MTRIANTLEMIGVAARRRAATIQDAFRLANSLSFAGDWLIEKAPSTASTASSQHRESFSAGIKKLRDANAIIIPPTFEPRALYVIQPKKSACYSCGR